MPDTPSRLWFLAKQTLIKCRRRIDLQSLAWLILEDKICFFFHFKSYVGHGVVIFIKISLRPTTNHEWFRCIATSSPALALWNKGDKTKPLKEQLWSSLKSAMNRIRNCAHNETETIGEGKTLSLNTKAARCLYRNEKKKKPKGDNVIFSLWDDVHATKRGAASIARSLFAFHLKYFDMLS